LMLEHGFVGMSSSESDKSAYGFVAAFHPRSVATIHPRSSATFCSVLNSL
jgi:hypothetical protein